jgi:hypothetical protein
MLRVTASSSSPTKRLRKADMASKQEKTLHRMLKMLLGDLRDLEHRGAGYYSVAPYADRYNKLLNHVRAIFPDDADLLASFEEMKPPSSSDPAAKVKAVEQLIVEIGQLIAFVEASLEEQPKEGGNESC